MDPDGQTQSPRQSFFELYAEEGHDKVGEPKVAARRDRLGRDREAREAVPPVDHVGLDGELEDCLGRLLALAPSGVDGKALPVAAALVIALVYPWSEA